MSATFVAVSVASAALLSIALKGAFARPRPELVAHLAHVLTPSFPSGHPMLSAAVYLTLGALLARHASLMLEAYTLLWALLLAFSSA